MANKRAFSKDFTNTDSFQTIDPSAQALYFHIGVNADDDGFIGNPLSITRCIGVSEKDISVLVDKGFLIPFPGGIYLVTDWLVNNYIRTDRYHSTVHQDFFRQVYLSADKRYSLDPNVGIPAVDAVKMRLGKNSIEEISIDEVMSGQLTNHFIPPSLSEIKEYCIENSIPVDPESFIDYYESNGWKVGKNPMKDWRAAVRVWARNEKHPSGNTVPDFSGWADELSGGGANT